MSKRLRCVSSLILIVMLESACTTMPAPDVTALPPVTQGNTVPTRYIDLTGDMPREMPARSASNQTTTPPRAYIDLTRSDERVALPE